MSKKIAVAAAAACSLLITSVFAQNFFGSNKNTPTSSPTAGSPASVSTQVMSDQDFQAKVNAMSKASKDKLGDQIAAELKPTPPAPKPPTGTTSSGISDPSKDKNSPPVAIELDKASASGTRSNQAPQQPRKPAANRPQAPAQANTPSSQPYSGFGTGGSQGSSGGGSNKQSGFGIQY